MFTVSGILSDKSLVKSGVSEKGTWKIITFLIEKTRMKKKIKIPIIAKGKLADRIDGIAIGERLTIRFYIKGNQYNDKYFTDCIAIEIDKFISKKKWEHGAVSFGNEVFEDKNDELKQDSHLFKDEKK